MVSAFVTISEFIVSSQLVATAIAGAKFVEIGQRGGGWTALEKMGTRKISFLLNTTLSNFHDFMF